MSGTRVHSRTGETAGAGGASGARTIGHAGSPWGRALRGELLKAVTLPAMWWTAAVTGAAAAGLPPLLCARVRTGSTARRGASTPRRVNDARRAVMRDHLNGGLALRSARVPEAHRWSKIRLSLGQ